MPMDLAEYGRVVRGTTQHLRETLPFAKGEEYGVEGRVHDREMKWPIHGSSGLTVTQRPPDEDSFIKDSTGDRTPVRVSSYPSGNGEMYVIAEEGDQAVGIFSVLPVAK